MSGFFVLVLRVDGRSLIIVPWVFSLVFVLREGLVRVDDCLEILGLFKCSIA